MKRAIYSPGPEPCLSPLRRSVQTEIKIPDATGRTGRGKVGQSVATVSFWLLQGFPVLPPSEG